jgi:hypothetical protein
MKILDTMRSTIVIIARMILCIIVLSDTNVEGAKLQIKYQLILSNAEKITPTDTLVPVGRTYNKYDEKVLLTANIIQFA